MLGILLAIVALGMLAALAMKTSYQAHSSVLVRLGPEYVYEPPIGEAGRGAVLSSSQMVQSEAEILRGNPLKLRVIERLGLARTYPQLAQRYARGSAAQKQAVMAQAVRAMERGLTIEAGPGSPIVRASFRHDDPQAAALILNTLLEEYLIYRRTVLVGPDAATLEQQRRLFEARLHEADAAYQAFLSSNSIGDFVAEKASLSALQAQIELQKAQTGVQLQDRVGRLTSLESQIGQVAPEIGLYRDFSGGPGEKAGEAGRRVGVNPVYQTLQIERIQLASEIEALKRAQVELGDQIEQLTTRRLRLAELEPRFQELSLDRDVLQASIRDVSVRVVQSRAAQEIAVRSSDSIRIVQRATPPTEGASLRLPVAVLSLLFGGFSALCAGLLAIFLRPGLPTPQSAARTLDLPILGAASLKAR